MLNEKEIKALKNGAYGVTRDGIKAKFITNTIDGFYTWAFYDDKGNAVDVVNDYSNFSRYFSERSSKEDIVGLWKDKPEPFDLERALDGESVLLRNGLKGFVYKMLDKPDAQNHQYFGVAVCHTADGSEYYHSQEWNAKLQATIHSDSQTNYDIIGMWKDPEPQPAIVQMPKPIYKINDNQEFLYRIGIADYYVVVKIPIANICLQQLKMKVFATLSLITAILKKFRMKSSTGYARLLSKPKKR